MTAEAHGPIDFVLLEFPGDRLTGRAAREVLDLVDRGTIALYDVSVVGRTTRARSTAWTSPSPQAGSATSPG